MKFSVLAPNLVTILRKIRGNSPESCLGIRRNSQESFTGKSRENVDSYSEEILVTRISKEMILEKFLGNSSKKVTMIGESGEIPHFCSLVNQYLIDEFLGSLLLYEIPKQGVIDGRISILCILTTEMRF